MRIARRLQALFCAAILILTAPTGLPQADTPQLTITVTDPSGARVANAAVTLSQGTMNRAPKRPMIPESSEAPDLTTGEWTWRYAARDFELQQRPVIFQGISQNVTVILAVAPLTQSVLVETTTEIPSAVQLNAIGFGRIVSGVAVRDLPYNLTVINQDYMRERGVTNLLDALELVSGVTTWADTGYIPAVDIRGLSTTDAGIFMAEDGIVQNSVPQAVRNQDTCFLESVEVLKGPSSFSYGSGTAGASINTRAKTPKRVLGIDTLFAYESFGKTRICLGVTGPITKNLAGRVDFSLNHGGTNIQRTQSTYRALNAALTWTPLERVTVSAERDLPDGCGKPILQHADSEPSCRSECGLHRTGGQYLPRPPRAHAELQHDESSERLEVSAWNVDDGSRSVPRLETAAPTLCCDPAAGHAQQRRHVVQPDDAAGDTGQLFLQLQERLDDGNQVDIRNTFRFWGGRSVSFTVGGKVERNNQGRHGADNRFGADRRRRPWTI